MKKVLFVSHTANFAKFNYIFMKWFKEQNWQVDYASDGKEEVHFCDHSYTICFERSPFKFNNIKAYRELKSVLEREKYDIIHCHTPMGGVIARLAARDSRKRGTKVIYTAHGFHFYQGASKVNWLCYYPVEKWLAKDTDCLVTINQEDYNNAMSRNFRAEHIEKINGVGVNLEKFAPVNQKLKKQLREEYGFSEEDFILICVAEINKNKNQTFMIQNYADLKEKIPKSKLLIVGVGDELENCKNLVRDLKLEKQILFLGYRADVDKLLKISDVLISASQREGLPVNIIEAMASGLPVVCANTRGQRDLIESGQNGYVYELGDNQAFIEDIMSLYREPELREILGKNSKEKAQKYSSEKAIESMSKIYQKYM